VDMRDDEPATTSRHAGAPDGGRSGPSVPHASGRPFARRRPSPKPTYELPAIVDRGSLGALTRADFEALSTGAPRRHRA